MSGIPDPGRASKAVRLAVDAAPLFDSLRQSELDGSEWWSARDLMPVLGYERWENFAAALDRAMAAADAQGHRVDDLFRGTTKKSGGRPQQDFQLSRFAAYLLAMNGDPRKREVADAQAYFAIRTREAELAEPVRSLPKSYAEALRELAAEVEARDLAEAKARELAVPASAWNELAEATGDYGVAEAAIVLSRDPNIKTGEKRLYQFMCGLGWVRKREGRWKAYQEQIENGRLAEKVARPFWHEGRGEMVNGAPTVRVTPKGLAELHRRLGGSGQLALIGPVA